MEIVRPIDMAGMICKTSDKNAFHLSHFILTTDVCPARQDSGAISTGDHKSIITAVTAYSGGEGKIMEAKGAQRQRQITVWKIYVQESFTWTVICQSLKPIWCHIEAVCLRIICLKHDLFLFHIVTQQYYVFSHHSTKTYLGMIKCIPVLYNDCWLLTRGLVIGNVCNANFLDRFL